MRHRFGTSALAIVVAALTAVAPIGEAFAAYSAREPGRGTITPERQYRPGPFTLMKTITVPAGTSVPVRVAGSYTSKTANGQRWHGTVTRSIYISGRNVVPAGSRIDGVVAAQPPHRGIRATIRLRATGVTARGRHYALSGVSGSIVARSPRARNLGGIAAGTVGGAIIGRAVGGSGKGAVVGGLIGAGATTAAVAASKGYQAKLPAGTVMTVHTTRAAKIKVPFFQRA
jgi:hypothetical protein